MLPRLHEEHGQTAGAQFASKCCPPRVAQNLPSRSRSLFFVLAARNGPFADLCNIEQTDAFWVYRLW